MGDKRAVRVGQQVVFHDPIGAGHDALVTCVFSGRAGLCEGDVGDCINMVYVSGDAAREDDYGRQIERVTSIVHKSRMSAHGNYWRFPDEEPNPYVAPTQK